MREILTIIGLASKDIKSQLLTTIHMLVSNLLEMTLKLFHLMARLLRFQAHLFPHLVLFLESSPIRTLMGFFEVSGMKMRLVYVFLKQGRFNFSRMLIHM